MKETLVIIAGYLLAEWLFLPDYGFWPDLLMAAAFGAVTAFLVGFVRAMAEDLWGDRR